jgi:hypothetical protein
MLFVGTYQDFTVCTDEGCPPIYSNSISLLKFNTESINPQTIVLSAKLKLFHYGSNTDLQIKVAKVKSSWSENSASLNPVLDGNFGEKLITNFNTTNPAQIREVTIDLSPTLFDNLGDLQNGIAILPSGDLDSPGIAFCSSNSDSFCLASYKPKLEIQYVLNEAPSKPIINTPEIDSKFGGNCDMSQGQNFDECNKTFDIPFKASNIYDDDPLSGALDYVRVEIFKNETPFTASPNLLPDPPGEVVFTGNLDDGVYTFQVVSIDKKSSSSASEKRGFVIDTTPPVLPEIIPLVNLTQLENNQIRLQIKGNQTTDNISSPNQISYRLQYSTDSSFQTNSIESEWQLNNSIFNLSNAELNFDKNYFFRIKAKDALGNISDWSDSTATKIDGLPMTPQIIKTNWEINDGVKADGIQPEINRFRNNSYVIKSKQLKLIFRAEQNKFIEVYMNNKLTTKVLANQNCNNGVCDVSYDLSFLDNGANDKNGNPLNSYSIQLRAIDENSNSSLLSSKEIIYHDSISPIKPEVKVSSDSPLVNLAGIDQTRGSQIKLDISAERYSDLEYKLLNSTGKIIETKLVRVPQNNKVNLNSNISRDGRYKIVLTSIDGAGNKSEVYAKEFIRDTTGPILNSINTSICEDKICLNINGEAGSTIITNNKNLGILDSTNKNIEVVKNWAFGRKYNFSIYLEDGIGNRSRVLTTTLITPNNETGGMGGINNEIYTEDSPEYAVMINKTDEFDEEFSITFDFFEKDKSYIRKDTHIPAPRLKATVTDGNGKIDVFGNAIQKDSKINIKVNKNYLTIYEATMDCGGLFATVSCIENKTKNPNAGNSLKRSLEGATSCLNINPLVYVSCANDYVFKDRVVEENFFDVKASDVKIDFYNNGDGDKHVLSYDHSSDADTRFKVTTNLNNPLKEGQKITSKTKVFGSIDWNGVVLNYDSAESGFSNLLSIDGKSEWKIIKDRDGKLVKGKVLDVPYFNQYLDDNQKEGEPSNGWRMCGAASSVMVSAYLKKIPLPNGSSKLKDYMYKDAGQGIVKGRSPKSILLNDPNNICNDGAFGVTGGGYICESTDPNSGRCIKYSPVNCTQSTVDGIRRYLTYTGLSSSYAPRKSYSILNIKDSIDKGNPLIMSIGDGVNFGHIIVVRGYIIDGTNKPIAIIANDPYRDLVKTPPNVTPGEYYLDGESVIYNLDKVSWPIKWAVFIN